MHSNLFFLLAILFIGCDSVPTEIDRYQPEPVLTAYLARGDTLNEIILERISPLAEYYEPKGIQDAFVRVYQLDNLGEKVDSFFFSEHSDPSKYHIYIKDDSKPLIAQELTEYQIEVNTPQGEYIWARTRVPGPIDGHRPVEIYFRLPNGDQFVIPTVFEIADTSDNNIIRLNRSFPNMTWEWGDVDSAAGFQGLSLALEPRGQLIPLDPNWDPTEEEIEDQYRGRYGYSVYRNDQRSVDVLWLAFQWVGMYRVELRALSQSYYDYLFSLFRVDQGLINAPTSNINGGLGIFGAYSRYTTHIYMEKVNL